MGKLITESFVIVKKDKQEIRKDIELEISLTIEFIGGTIYQARNNSLYDDASDYSIWGSISPSGIVSSSQLTTTSSGMFLPPFPASGWWPQVEKSILPFKEKDEKLSNLINTLIDKPKAYHTKPITINYNEIDWNETNYIIPDELIYMSDDKKQFRIKSAEIWQTADKEKIVLGVSGIQEIIKGNRIFVNTDYMIDDILKDNDDNE